MKWWPFGRKKEEPPPVPRGRPAPPPPEPLAIRVDHDSSFEVPVVGESHYQKALEAVAGPRTMYRKVITEARLVCEDDNPHSKTGATVRVDIEGRRVGYIKSGDNVYYRRWLEAQGHPKVTVVCPAKIAGGGKDGDRLRYYGVWLDLPPQAMGWTEEVC